MQVSRRKFLETAAVLAAASPLISRNSSGDDPVPVEGAVAMALAVREGRTTQLALVGQAIARLEKANPWINAVSLLKSAGEYRCLKSLIAQELPLERQ
jgi:hypothetical protein